MKNSMIILSIAALLFAGCAGNQTKEHEQNDASHKHDDGSVHQNHEEESAIKQEEFTVPVDNTSQKADSMHKHTHEQHDGHENPHKH